MTNNIIPLNGDSGEVKAEEKRFLHVETTDGKNFRAEIHGLGGQELAIIVEYIAESIRKDAEETFGKDAETEEDKAANDILIGGYVRFVAEIFHEAIDKGLGIDDAGNEPDAPAKAPEEADHE